ncbi:MAG: C25 family cysteine peptidase [Bacteroidetes bacterium]|nr:C25 family cysteine peptidase [Bacteroidota bacterium]MCL2301920.1 C25 family cysteine peptidase [Lentimicrobiaceae bacterium]
MKRFFLLIFLSLFISNLFAQEMTYSHLRDGNGISINLELKSYNINSLSYKNEEMHEVALSGIFIPNDEGMPNLPRISRLVAIPKGAEVKISIKNMETQRLENINIAPALRIQPIPEIPVADYVKNEKIYSTNAFYPQNPVEVSEITNLRGVNAVVVGITPFQFNPVTKELIIINNIELEVEYIGGSNEYGDPKYRSPWFDPILKHALLNYEMLPDVTYRGKNSEDREGCEYLIIIPNRNDFESYAEQIKEFRTKQGIFTKVMRLDEMEVTNTDQLKAYIHNAYKFWDIPPVAILLMGDHHTDMSVGIPAEVVPHPYVGSCISDNQYADVTGNLLPDIITSRMAAETEEQMAVLVSKFLEYETQPCMDPDFYQNPITALGWQTDRWFQICTEAISGYWRQTGKTPTKISDINSGVPGAIWSSAQNTEEVVNYFGPNGLGYIPETPVEVGGWDGGTAADVVNAVNTGSFVLLHRDHGYYAGWGEPAFTIPNISQLTNVGKMTYLFTINCQTGQFNYPIPSFGEVFHRYTYQGQNAGCVGFIGPTEITYSFINDAYVWGMYDFYHPDFLPDFGPSYGPDNGPYVGYSANWMPAFGNVAGKYFLYQSSWPFNIEDKDITYHMFTAHSDAFLRLFTEVPQTLSVSHAEATLAGNSNFYITANEGALIALTAMINGNLEILDVAIATGETQAMTIPTTLIPGTEINVVGTGQNFLRYEEVVLVIPAEGPYVVPTAYSVVNEEKLTYISQNSEITITLKNVGSDPTTEQLTVTISCDDPQLTIDNGIAQVANIMNSNEITTANFNVTVAHSIPDNKTFLLTVTVTEGGTATWESKIPVKAYAPKFSFEKLLVNNIEGAKLEEGAIVTLTAVVKNTGRADAYAVVGDIENGEFITLICDEANRAAQDLPVGESINLNFIIFTNPSMPFGYEAAFNLLLSAQYGLSFSAPFKILSSDYCVPGLTVCGGYKFTSVQLVKTSDQSVLINNTNSSCSPTGYQDYTDIVATLIPGEQYTIKVKTTQRNNNISGWMDLNGSKTFDATEQLISFVSVNPNTEYSQTFTIPQDALPGKYYFRLRTRRNQMPEPCNAYTDGQTHDYIVIIPEIYPRVQNVLATLNGTNITINWEAPNGETPVGYNIYRNDNRLNTSLITTTNFTEENVSDGIYFYSVTSVYAGNKESVPVISNFICQGYTPPQLCGKPVNLLGVSAANTVFINWNRPKYVDGIILGYHIYRDGSRIAETAPTVIEYRDEGLANGTYSYQVSAVYEHCEESELTSAIPILVGVGINETQQDSYQLFPNPATEEVTIKGEGLNHAEIYDITGRKLSSHPLIPSSSHQKIDISYLNSGVYFVKMCSENQQMAIRRLVIMK